MVKQHTQDDILGAARAYQFACVLTAAGDLDVFSVLGAKAMTAQILAGELGADSRAMTILLDALVALELLSKDGMIYKVPDEISELLTETSTNSVLPMVRHQGNCIRRWAQLARVIQNGGPAESSPSIRGSDGDREAFIGAMNNVSVSAVEKLIDELRNLRFGCVLDIGGASGTWTIAFLEAYPDAKAILFDLPEVIPMARKRIGEAGLADRVTFVAGDYYRDELPSGADFAWLSAIAHQNSRKQNRQLFAKIKAALVEDGFIMIRDVVMEESRTSPQEGALFAINMLVATQGGGTYTFDEFQEDLTGAGFGEVSLIRRDDFMDSLIMGK